MSFLKIKPMRKRVRIEYTHKAAMAEVERMYPGEPVTRVQRLDNGDLVVFTEQHNVTFHSTRLLSAKT